MRTAVLDILANAPRSLRQAAARPFSRNVAVMAGGTVIAQGIVIAASPVITRLYGPEAFGTLGVFLSLTDVLAPLASLAYTHAICLPAKDEDALSLVKLSMAVSLAFAGLVALVLAVLHRPLTGLFELGSVSAFLPLVPLFVVLGTLNQASVQWLIRKRRFASQSKVTVASAVTQNAAKIGFGMWSPTAATLVALAAAGNFLGTAMLALGARRAGGDAGAGKGLKAIAVEYRKFPIYRAPQILLNTFSRNLPLLVLSAVFSPAVAGFYALGHRILMIPAEIVGKAFASVFMSRFTEAVHRREAVARMIVKATLALGAIGLLPFGAVVLGGPALFAFAFGSEWATAGEYARWMSLLLYANFLARPASQSLLVQNRQGFLLGWDMASTALTVLILFGCGWFLKNQLATIACYSVAGAASYAVLIAEGIRNGWKRDSEAG